MKRISAILLFISLQFISRAESCSKSTDSLPVIDGTVINNWKYLADYPLGISSDARYIMYFINNAKFEIQGGFVRDIENKWVRELPAIDDGFFAPDGKTLYFRCVDSLFSLNLGAANVKLLATVASYKRSNDPTKQWLACMLKNGNRILLVKNLLSKEECRFENVVEYGFSPATGVLLLVTKSVGGRQQVKVIDLTSGTVKDIWSATTDREQISSYCFDETGEQIAFIVTCVMQNLTTNSILYYNKKLTQATIQITDRRPEWSNRFELETSAPQFCGNANFLVFRVKEKRKSLPNPSDNIAQLDIWSYADKILPPDQRTYPAELTYTFCLSLADNRLCQLEGKNEKVDQIITSGFALVHDMADLDFSFWWPNREKQKYWLISLKSGMRKALGQKNEWLDISASPDGDQIVYYDVRRHQFNSYSILNGGSRCISKGINGQKIFEDSLWSYPPKSFPVLYGSGIRWLKNENSILVNDKFDIWQLHLDGKKAPINLTNGYGRSHNIIFDLACLSGTVIISKSDISLLQASAVDSKYAGFYRMGYPNSDPILLTMGPWKFSPPVKALSSNAWLLLRQSDKESPNLFLTRDFKHYTELTNVQPQTNCNWLTTQLLKWKQLDGAMTQGILYLPQNFNRRKKYPVIIQYYETKTQDIYRFQQPDFSSGEINVPWFVSRGYLVLQPDIQYTWGSRNGGQTATESAYNAVESAAVYLGHLPYVDSSRIGLQGHSFGGGETLYIIAHSKRFAAACAAAATVSDEISAYLDAKYSRILHSEAGHDKIGATLWQRPDLFIRSSPVFNADKVTTPLLLMHNKGDRVTNWNQSLQMFTALRRIGKPSWLLQYDKGDHGVSGEDAVDYTMRMEQFFDHYLKDAMPPKWMTQGRPAYLKGIDGALELDTTIKTIKPLNTYMPSIDNKRPINVLFQ